MLFAEKEIDYTKVCFVIMPFGKKKVGDKDVEFDSIYENIFVPAISAAVLPEGGNLIPKRTDKDFFSGNIDTEMFQYLEYSRFTLADISGLNPNVFYEIGVRHHANESGTAIFRQANVPLPFDISRIKAFPYDYEPTEQVETSRKLIIEVLTESLQYNRLDSPVQIALATQRIYARSVDDLLKDASNCIRNHDLPAAIAKYKDGLVVDSQNPKLHLQLGLLYKETEEWNEAVLSFSKAMQFSANYSDAYRELGIAENKVYHKNKKPETLPTGEKSLRKAIDLNPHDFDALSSLGGVLKRERLYDEALEMYEKATEVSKGHPYPLLNALILKVRKGGLDAITPKQKFLLSRAEIVLRRQIEDTPPYNVPWCFFDLSEICLFLSRVDEGLQFLEKGLTSYAKKWQAETHLSTLKLIGESSYDLPGLGDSVEMLEKTIKYLE